MANAYDTIFPDQDFYIGATKIFDASDNGFAAPLQIGGSATTALTLGGGTSGSRLTTASADKNFVAFYVSSTATSGDVRCARFDLSLAGTIAATGYGDCIRALTTVSGTGYSYASGIHSTLSIAVGGTVTGSGSAARLTLGAASASRTLNGNIACLQLDSDIAASNTVPANMAFIRVTKSGSVDIATFMHITDDQCLKGSAATGAATDALPVLMPSGTTLYISLIAAS
jgi:hypothetical protein